MEWDSPWGIGFPGWHTECVVMASKTLGVPCDIHCGGIDHIQIHHTNEIAQSQAAFGNNLANVWLHGAFLNISGEKISKSSGNFITLDNLTERGFSPLSLRYLFLTAKYRAKLDFSFENLRASQSALNNFKQKFSVLRGQTSQQLMYRERFLSHINDDLNTPQALALAWDVIKDKALSSAQKHSLLLEFDKVFGFGLKDVRQAKIKIPAEIKKFSQEREEARQNKDWQSADYLRKKIKALGFEIEDTESGPKITFSP